MKLIATIPARNEDWCLGLSARIALLWCDEIVVLDHASTDATPDIISDLTREYPGRVHSTRMPEETWREMEHRQTLLEMARNRGATHIAIIDADEILTANLAAIWSKRKDMWPNVYGMIMLPGYNLRGGIDRFHVDGTWGKRWFSTVFLDHQRLHWAVRQRPGGEEDHHQRNPMGLPLTPYKPIRQGQGGTMHLWGASERRLIAKHRAYKMRDALRWPEKSRVEIDKMYSLAIHGNPPHEMPQGWQYQKCPADWWVGYEHLMKYLDVDAEPWQEKWCEDLLAKHGSTPFEGLDLFGLV